MGNEEESIYRHCCDDSLNPPSTPRPTSGPPASGFPSPSRWAGPGRLWITPSSSRGTRPWNSSCGAPSTTPPRRRPGPGSRPGSRTTTTTAGTPRWAGSPRWITSVAGGKGARVTAGRPLRGPGPEGGGFAAAHLHHRAAAFQAGGRAARGYGAAPPASSPSVAAGQPRTVQLPGTPTREDSLDPGTSATPQAGSTGQGPACPALGAARPEPLPGEHGRTPGNEVSLAFDTQKKRRN